MPYRIEYSPEVEEHLRVLSPFHRNAVMDAIDEQLTHQPDVETRNRKPMRPNPIAPWELRVGNVYTVTQMSSRSRSYLSVPLA